ncbi:MAG: glycosyltransferase family 39 protein [Sediminibacterium sp.]
MKKIGIGETYLWKIVFLLALLVYAAGLFVEVLEPDAAVYAEVSREMFVSGRWLDIFLMGADWLDKPHLQFWVTAWSYSLFGLNIVAYKLPAVLSVLLAAWYTYLFAKKHYSEKHGIVAALILMTAQHTITSNMDVRAEPYMTLFTIMALYHIAEYLNAKKTMQLVYCSVALAALMMTKGLFTIIPVAAGVGCTLLYQKRWKEILHWQWLLTAVLTLVFMFPTLYGYYQQFDLHPEKWVFGRQHVSGIRFFLIDSQWGRFANSGPIKGSGDPFFFVHTLIWAFLPWAWLAYFALIQKTKALFQRNHATETYTYFGFLVMFLIFSASKFQLAHYLNPVFPLLAVMAAAALMNATQKALRVLTVMQVVTIVLLLIALGMLMRFFQDSLLHTDTLLVLIAGMLLAAVVYFTKSKVVFAKLIFVPVLVTLSINYYLNREFYPRLTNYQSESAVADYYLQQQLPADRMVSLDVTSFSTSFKLNTVVPPLWVDKVKADELQDKYVYTTQHGLELIDSLQIPRKQVHRFADFHITMLTGEFLNKATRDSTLTPMYLVKTGKIIH